MLSAIAPIPSTLQVQAQPQLDSFKHTPRRCVNNAQQKTDRWSAARVQFALPAPQQRVVDAEILGNLAHRVAIHRHQPHRLCLELVCERPSLACHLSPPLGPYRACRGVRQTGGRSYLYNEGQVRLWPYPRANGEHTIAVLQRLRAEASERKLIVLWDGASYPRAGSVRD